jgi:hypothetical protein
LSPTVPGAASAAKATRTGAGAHARSRYSPSTREVLVWFCGLWPLYAPALRLKSSARAMLCLHGPG